MRRPSVGAALVLAALLLGLSLALAAPPSGSKVTLSITNAVAREGSSGRTALVFTVSAAGSFGDPVRVRLTTANSTASAPADFRALTTTLTLDRRHTSRTVAVAVVADTGDEPDESLHVRLSHARGAEIADGDGIGTIVDDDGRPSALTRIAAAGDIACDPETSSFEGGRGRGLECRQLATSNLLVGAGYAAVLALGDIQYEDGDYSKFLASYDRSWGRVKSITRPVPGNHEYRSGSAAGYYRYFGAAAGDPARGYYSYDLRGWHLIALNSNCSFVGGCGAGSPQEQWLRADLRRSRAVCTLAYWHHPRFSSGEHGSDSTYVAFWQALYDANADVVLVGHDHDYERFGLLDASGSLDRPRGIREFVVGSGGKNLRTFPKVRPWSQARDATSLGILELGLAASWYSWRFRPAVGAFKDSGVARCH